MARVRLVVLLLLVVGGHATAHAAGGVRPIGPEIVVVAGGGPYDRIVYDRYSLDVAGDDFGNFIVVWSDYDQVRGVRLSASDVPSAAFAIGDDPLDRHLTPRAAVQPSGDFVVTWTTSPLASAYEWMPASIKARRFDRTGTPRNDAAEVQGFPTGDGWSVRSNVGIAAAGAFVVVWDDFDADGFGVFARRFDAAGSPIGVVFPVNADESGSQGGPAVATDPTGGFVVVWEVYGDGEDNIASRRFAPDGTAAQPESLVNEVTQGGQGRPAVDSDAAGNFVVTWLSHYDENIYGSAVAVRRFDATANPLGDEAHAVKRIWNTGREWPHVAVDPGGDFVVVWSSFYYENGDIMARSSAGGGQSLSPKLRVDTHVENDPIYRNLYPQVATGGSGDFLVVWVDETQGLVARRLGPPRSTTKLRLKDDADPSRRKLTIKPVGSVTSSRLGTRIDPARDGAFLHVYNASGAGTDSTCIPLPAAHWTAKGGDSAEATRFVYRDPEYADGPCASVTVVNRKVVKAACKAKLHPIEFSLDEAQQGSLVVRLVTGERTYCSVFGSNAPVDEPGRFAAANASLAGECPAAPASCP